MAYLIFVRLGRSVKKTSNITLNNAVIFRLHNKAEQQVTQRATFRLQPSIFNDKAQINFLSVLSQCNHQITNPPGEQRQEGAGGDPSGSHAG